MRPFILLLLLLALLALAGSVTWTGRAADDLRTAIQELAMPTTVTADQIKTTWTDWQGLNREVITNRQSWETDAELVARHDALVDTALETWPLTEPQ